MVTLENGNSCLSLIENSGTVFGKGNGSHVRGNFDASTRNCFFISINGRRRKNRAVEKLHSEEDSAKGNRFRIRNIDDSYTTLTNYYFTNIPDEYGTVEMRKKFQRWGQVRDVFIPKKRNKQGKRFGFVKFKNVKEPTRLERKLNKIRIGGVKIRVNISKYERRAKNDWKGLEHNVGEEEMGWLRKCYFGIVRDPVEDVFNLQENLFSGGIPSLKITPMGGNMVLIQSKEEEEVLPSLIQDYSGTLEKWFSDYGQWSPEKTTRTISGPYRLAWVRCFGIPVHAWSEIFFKKIVGVVGSSSLISVDANTCSKRRLDEAKILIKTSSPEVINTTINIKINGLIFSITLLEEPSYCQSSIQSQMNR